MKFLPAVPVTVDKVEGRNVCVKVTISVSATTDVSVIVYVNVTLQSVG